jgi:hypothetical protein
MELRMSCVGAHAVAVIDYVKGQSVIEAIRTAGRDRILILDWKGATPAMKDYDIDAYLAGINAIHRRRGTEQWRRINFARNP